MSIGSPTSTHIPDPVDALRSLVIPLLGRMIQRHINRSNTPFFFADGQRSDREETPEGREARMRGRTISLGWAGCALAGRGILPNDPSYLSKVQYEYTRIAGMRTVADVIHKKQYDANRYRAQRGLGPVDRVPELAALEVVPDVAEVVEANNDDSADRWLEQLSPVERAALERELNGEPTSGAADRQARSRAKRRLRGLMSQIEPKLIPNSAGGNRMPTMVERVTALEVELAAHREAISEHARQLGLTHESEKVSEAVEHLLASLDLEG